MQGMHDSKPWEVLVSLDLAQVTDAGKSRHKTRKWSKGRKKSGDAVTSGDINDEADSTESCRVQDLLFLSAGSGESYPTRTLDDAEGVELFEVKRYPAYHYDMYGTIFSLTDGVRPSTLERDTIKSASADCLDVLSLSAQASGAVAAVPQTSAVVAERKPVLPGKPKPLPRTKPIIKHSTTRMPVKDTDTQTAMKSASTDPAFMAELSSLLKQRNQ